MESSNHASFKLGEFVIQPDLDRIQGPDGVVEVEPKTMAVLVYLTQRAGDVVSADDLIEHIWQGRPMGDNPVYKCIAKLRKALIDDSRSPHVIATVPKKGYRLLLKPEELPVSITNKISTARFEYRTLIVVCAVAVLIAAMGIVWLIPETAQNESQINDASVAVMEFVELEGNQGSADLGTGIGEEIRMLLSRIEGLSVASRTASSALLAQNTNPTPQDVRGTLFVAYALEGTVRVTDGSLHYTAQLIDTETGYQVWAASETRDHGDILDVQEEIADAVVRALRVKVLRDLATPVRSTNSVEAYEEFRRGKSYMAQPLLPEVLAAAEDHFKKALLLDPGYARAHAGLCQVSRRWFKSNGNVIHYDAAEVACLKAAELDPELSEVPLALGNLYRDSGRHIDSVVSFERSIALNPNNMEAYQGLAYTYAAMNQTAKAEELLAKAQEMFPHVATAHSRYAVFLYRQGRYHEALSKYQMAYRLGRTGTTTLNSMAASYFMLGDFEMAIRYWQDSLAKKKTASAHTNLGTAYYFLGRYEEAVGQYREAVNLAPADYAMWVHLAAGMRQLPDRDGEVTDICVQAVELGQDELSVNPNDAMVLSRIAFCMALQGDLDGARQAVSRAAQLSPHEPNVLFNCAVALIDIGDLEQAVAMTERAIEQGYPENHVWVSPELRKVTDILRVQKTE